MLDAKYFEKLCWQQEQNRKKSEKIVKTTKMKSEKDETGRGAPRLIFC